MPKEKKVVTDETANASFDKFVGQLTGELKSIEIEELGTSILPKLSQAMSIGRTRHIQKLAAQTVILVMREMQGRSDCQIRALKVNLKDGVPSGEPVEGGLDEAIEEIEKKVKSLDAEEQAEIDKAKSQAPVSSEWDSVKFDDLFKAGPAPKPHN